MFLRMIVLLVLNLESSQYTVSEPLHVHLVSSLLMMKLPRLSLAEM